jgi:hypothetical protein
LQTRQRNVGCLQRDVGPRPTHRHPDLGLGQRGRVVDACGDARGVANQDRLRAVQGVLHRGVGEAVVDEAARLPRHDQAAVLEAGQVAGDVRLGEPGRDNKLGDAALPVA